MFFEWIEPASDVRGVVDAAHVQLLYSETGWIKSPYKILEFPGRNDLRPVKFFSVIYLYIVI